MRSRASDTSLIHLGQSRLSIRKLPTWTKLTMPVKMYGQGVKLTASSRRRFLTSNDRLVKISNLWFSNYSLRVHWPDELSCRCATNCLERYPKVLHGGGGWNETINYGVWGPSYYKTVSDRKVVGKLMSIASLFYTCSKMWTSQGIVLMFYVLGLLPGSDP